MASEQDSVRKAQQDLPEEMHSQVGTLVNLLMLLKDGLISQAEVQDQINKTPALSELYNVLAGLNITTGNTTIQFGSNSQSGDITIRDVARGNINYFTVNLFSVNTNKAVDHNLTDSHLRMLPSAQAQGSSSAVSGASSPSLPDTILPVQEQMSTVLSNNIHVSSSASHKSLAHTFFIHHPVTMEFVQIPAGEFIMGSVKMPNGYKREQPQHKVYVSEFYMSRYLVTLSQYAAFAQDTGRPFNLVSNNGNCPVTCITWDEANAYCQWLSAATHIELRLPTEAEWEKAARGTDGRIYPWGNSWDSTGVSSRGFYEDYVVGAFSPESDSPYGIADMCGRVWQWCVDSRDDKVYINRKNITIQDPRVTNTDWQRALRGGNSSDGLRCAYRHFEYLRWNRGGIRVVTNTVPDKS